MMRASRAVLGKVLLFAEADSRGVTAATLSAVTAATKLGEVTAVCAGKDNAEKVAKVAGVSKVAYSDSASVKHGLAENVTTMLLNYHKAGGFSHIVAPASDVGKSVAPRLGAALDVQPFADIMEVKSEDTFVRGNYAGNVLTEVKSKDSVKVLTVRGASFDKADATSGSASVEDLGEVADSGLSEWVEDQTQQSDKPELASANVVISGGRGLKSGDNFKILYDLADKLGAAVGATRAVVDAGWVPSDMQVGQTGKIVAPSLYIACGLSGAVQHVTGMKDSKTIVAINTDEEAPIMALADYGLVADVHKAVPEMTQKL